MVLTYYVAFRTHLATLRLFDFGAFVFSCKTGRRLLVAWQI